MIIDRFSTRSGRSSAALLLLGGSLLLPGFIGLNAQDVPRPAASPPASVVTGTGTSSMPALRWDARRGVVSARIEGWTLPRLLQQLSDVTGWDVYFEPDSTQRISTRFQGLNTGDALTRLLPNLNYALLPQTNGPSQLFVFRTSVQEATEALTPQDRKKAGGDKAHNAIPNELIVTLKPGSAIKIEDLAAQLGAKVLGKIDGLDAYRLGFKDDAAMREGQSQLASMEGVASTEFNYAIESPRRPELLSHSSGLPLNLKPKTNADGSRLIVGLIDMPVQVQGTTLKDFLLPGLTVSGEPVQTAPSRELSHGTSMAETILRGLAVGEGDSKASSVRILPVDVYGGNQTTTTFDVAQGVYAAVKNGANMINLSLGTYSESQILQQIIQQSTRQGVVFFGAAGNEPVTLPTYPAAYPEVVAVTAGDRSGRLASYANRGAFVDVMGPGAGVVQFNDQSYLGSGTSFATAYVTGLAAGMASSSGKTPAQIEAEIRQRLGVRPVVPVPKP